ncbi:TetR/AcrR family transcriptional regulator [Cyanobium sp. ULC065]
MRYADGHKQAVRERILRAAAAELRRQGLSGIGIPALMKQAGLTHGAFYSHFQSRDALVAEAIRTAAAASAEGPLAEGLSLEQSLAFYLSPEHVAHPERGCVIAALGGEGVASRRPCAPPLPLRPMGCSRRSSASCPPARPPRCPAGTSPAMPPQ